MKKKKEKIIDSEARTAILQIASQLYGNTLSLDFVKGLEEYLFPKEDKKK